MRPHRIEPVLAEWGAGDSPSRRAQPDGTRMESVIAFAGSAAIMLLVQTIRWRFVRHSPVSLPAFLQTPAIWIGWPIPLTVAVYALTLVGILAEAR